MTEADVRTKTFAAPKLFRGTQLIFGERKHLLEVLRSIQSAKLPRARKLSETRQLKKLIATRTQELNRITPAWDRKFKLTQNPKTAARDLLKLSATLSHDDYLMARVLTEHAEAPPALLERMAVHPYAAVRENVARHPHTPPDVLRKLAEEASEPLWFLVACNPSAPSQLREHLRARMRGAGNAPTDPA
jgi:Leucine rich repeat variant